MVHRVSICWPSCRPELVKEFRSFLKARRHKEYSVEVSEGGTGIDSILLQAYPIELLERANCDMEAYAAKRKAVMGKGGRTRVLCFSYERDAVPRFAQRWPEDAVHHATGEEADRLARGMARPLLDIEPVSKRTCEMIEQIVATRSLLLKARVPGALVFGDVAMACYGIRKAREGRTEIIVTGAKALDPAQKKTLERHGVSYSFLGERSVENGVLKHYHGIDMADIAAPEKNNSVFFMGLMIPTKEMSFLISRARTGGYDSDAQLLDSVMLKPPSYGAVLPCVFADSYETTFHRLEYGNSDNILGRLKRYKESTGKLSESVCKDAEGDYGFDIREGNSGSEKEMESSAKLLDKLKGMPVFAMQYGVIRCGAKHFVAAEASDYTLAEWAGEQHSAEDWEEVVARVTWAAAVMEDSGLRHGGLDASSVVIRIAHGKRNKRTAVPVSLGGLPLPSARWDVRFIGAAQVLEGSDAKAMQPLGRELKKELAKDLRKGAKHPPQALTLAGEMARATTKGYSEYLSGIFASKRRQQNPEA